jgi:hypothetical protein
MFTFQIILDYYSVSSCKTLVNARCSIEISRSRVVGKAHVGDRFHTLNHRRLYVVDVNWRPGGALRRKRRILS